MTHGDDAGLRIPPRLAPIQVLVMIVKDGDGVSEAAAAVVADLKAAGARVELDDRTDTAFGRRAVDAELKGIPVRVEIGPRDVAEGKVTLARRISGGKEPVALESAAALVTRALDEDHRALYDEALAHRESNTVDVQTLEEAAEAAATGFARIPWATLGVDGEKKLAESAITVRCLVRPDGEIPESDDEDGALAVVARAY